MSKTGRLTIGAGTMLLVILGSACDGPTRARPDVLLVVLDTLRSDAVSSLGGPPGTTPNLDALAAQGILYTHAFAPGPWTLPSHASLFTGLGIEDHGVGIRGRVTPPEELTTLAERLHAEGYETASFSENPLVTAIGRYPHRSETGTRASSTRLRRLDSVLRSRGGRWLRPAGDSRRVPEFWSAGRRSPVFSFVV